MLTFRTTSRTCRKRHELRVLNCHSACPGCAAMTVRRASVTTLTANTQAAPASRQSPGVAGHTLEQTVRSRKATCSFKRHTRTRTRTHARKHACFAISTYMLVTGAEANPLRSNWTPNVHKAAVRSVFVLFCPLSFANNTQQDHTHSLKHTHTHSLSSTSSHTHIHKTRSPVRRRSEEERGGVRCCWGVITGHAHSLTRVRTHARTQGHAHRE